MKRLVKIGCFQLILAWYDMWVGAYYDVGHKTLYILPLPFVVFRFEFKSKRNEVLHRKDRLTDKSYPPMPTQIDGERDEDLLHKQLYPQAAQKPEYIICAAIHFKDDLKYNHQPRNIESGFVICGRRHHNCFMSKKILEFSEVKGTAIQGFLTSKDRFIDRKEGGEIAFKTGQIIYETNCLFSEDLY